MPDPGVLDLLRSQPPFRELPPARRERLAPACRVARLAPGELLVEQGQELREVFLIVEGALFLHLPGQHGRHEAAHLLSRGLFFGEATALQGGAWPLAAAAAADGALLLAVEARAFLELVRQEPDFALGLLGTLSAKLFEASRRVGELSVASANTRLARYLLALERRRSHGVVELELPVNKRDLATLLATTPEHLSRLLRRWGDAHIARSSGRTVTVLNLELLEALAEDAPGEPDAG